MSTVNTVFQSMRPPFLLLTPICILLGIASTISLHGQVDINKCILILLGGLFAHISVNTFNEYFDYKSGLDFETQKTPFSGGSGALPENPVAVKGVLLIAITTLVLTAAIGLVLISKASPILLALGLSGLVIIVSYTPLINKLPLLCLIAPGLAFGPFFIMGTYLSLVPASQVVTDNMLVVFITSLLPFFLVNNLLLLNQLPDIEADKRFGRKTFPIQYGATASIYIYLMFLFAAAFIILTSVIANYYSWPITIAIIPLALGLLSFLKLKQAPQDFPANIPALAQNVMCTLITIFCYGITILFSL